MMIRRFLMRWRRDGYFGDAVVLVPAKVIE
jgi:hypothetical protein